MVIRNRTRFRISTVGNNSLSTKPLVSRIYSTRLVRMFNRNCNITTFKWNSRRRQNISSNNNIRTKLITRNRNQ